MIDSTKPIDPSTRWGRFRVWFHNNINWCEGTIINLKNPEIVLDKSPNRVYDWFYNHWLWPFQQTGCACCNTVRGVCYGILIGFIFGKLL